MNPRLSAEARSALYAKDYYDGRGFDHAAGFNADFQWKPNDHREGWYLQRSLYRGHPAFSILAVASELW